MKTTTKLTNEQMNAKRLSKLTVNKLVADFKWEIEYCEGLVAQAEANKAQNTDPTANFQWGIDAFSKQAEGARKALKRVETAYAHFSKEEREMPLINPALSYNAMINLEHSLKMRLRNE